MWQVSFDTSAPLQSVLTPFHAEYDNRIAVLAKAHNASVYSMDKRIAALETKLNQATSVCNCTNRLNGLQEAVEALGRQLATLRAER